MMKYEVIIEHRPMFSRGEEAWKVVGSFVAHNKSFADYFVDVISCQHGYRTKVREVVGETV